MLTLYIWNEMTREEIKELNHGLVVVSIGATEQHGYHLPVETDNVIGRQVVYESVKKASGDIPVILGPHIPFGHSHHHFLYAGAISLSMKTLIIVLKEVIESIAKSGFNKLFIVNSHGGNDDIIKLVAKEISYDETMNISAGSYWNYAEEDIKRFRAEHNIFDFGHAGQFETSLMMAIKPELVKMENLKKEKEERESFELNLGSVVKATTNVNLWTAIDGYSDEPAKAKQEYGEGLLRVISDRLSQELIEFYNASTGHKLSHFKA